MLWRIANFRLERMQSRPRADSKSHQIRQRTAFQPKMELFGSGSFNQSAWRRKSMTRANWWRWIAQQKVEGDCDVQLVTFYTCRHARRPRKLSVGAQKNLSCHPMFRSAYMCLFQTQVLIITNEQQNIQLWSPSTVLGISGSFAWAADRCIDSPCSKKLLLWDLRLKLLDWTLAFWDRFCYFF